MSCGELMLEKILLASIWLPVSQQQSTAAPGESTIAPGGSTLAPGATTASPGGSTAAPGATTVPPGGSTAAPGATTVPPGGSTAAPGATTVPPGGSTAAPGATTVPPGGSTAAPGATTVPPGGSTAAPGATTIAPGSSSGAPGVTTGAPGASTGPPGGSSIPPSSAAPGGTTTRPWPRPNCDTTRVTRTQRDIFLDTHNNYRGSLARGQGEVNRNWGIAPPSALTYRMQYDCDAESYALQAVSTCRTSLLPANAIGPHKQNIHILRTTETTPEGALQNAMATWWSQLANFGIRSNMMFYPSEFARGQQNVLSWSKMAWWSNIRVGCATQNCGTFYLTSCMYNPGGNYENSYVYRVGAVCSECSPTNCDIFGLCRW